MKHYYTISIPSPCHEDWDRMTPNEKGRFCDLCSKTVIDFTMMNIDEIQEFIHQNKNHRICGHIKQKQLEAINLKIPVALFQKRLNFQKMFLLALLIVMGTTLLSCTGTNGKHQKINTVEVIDSSLTDTISVDTTAKHQKPSLGNTQKTVDTTTIINVKNDTISNEIVLSDREIVGEMIILGEIEITPDNDLDVSFPVALIENPPEFKNTPQHLSASEKRAYFSARINTFIKDRFKLEKNLTIERKHRLYTQFTIDSLGFVTDLKIRGADKKLEEQIRQIMDSLPQFLPAIQDGKNVAAVYSLPIVFEPEN